MPTTRGYPYPSLDAPANVPAVVQDLAEAIDEDVADIDARLGGAEETIAEASASAIPGTLVRRSAGGPFAIAEATADSHPPTRGYVRPTVEDVAAAEASAVFGTLVRRSSTTGHFAVVEPTSDGHPTSKGYVDTLTGPTRDAIAHATGYATPGTLVERNADGYFEVKAAQTDKHPTTKGYVDTITQQAREDVAAAQASAVFGTLVRRSSTTGHFAVVEPTSDGHPASKGYVDRQAWASRSSVQSVAGGNGRRSVTFTLPTGRFSASPVAVAGVQCSNTAADLGAQVTAVSGAIVTCVITNHASAAEDAIISVVALAV